MTIKEEEKKSKKGGQGNKGRKSKKKSTPKEDLKISKHPKSGKGLYYGNDGIKWDPVRKIFYDATVHKTKT